MLLASCGANGCLSSSPWRPPSKVAKEGRVSAPGAPFTIGALDSTVENVGAVGNLAS